LCLRGLEWIIVEDISGRVVIVEISCDIGYEGISTIQVGGL
jgi:hypothetical protein